MSELYNAICSNKLSVVKSLLYDGADVNETYMGVPMLYHALDSGDRHDNAEIVDCLIKMGANKDKLWDYKTPLHYVIAMGNYKLAKCLIDNGADMEALHQGKTALHYAIHENNTEIVKYLIEKGANKEALWVKKTPLHHAIFRNNNEVIKYLIKKGAKIEALHQNKTPLHFALGLTKYEIAKSLVEKGANKYAIFNGETALHSVLRRLTQGIYSSSVFEDPFFRVSKIFHNIISFLNFLVDDCSLVNVQDQDGDTPIHLVVIVGNLG